MNFIKTKLIHDKIYKLWQHEVLTNQINATAAIKNCMHLQLSKLLEHKPAQIDVTYAVSQET
jgi:hypothetical protein